MQTTTANNGATPALVAGIHRPAGVTRVEKWPPATSTGVTVFFGQTVRVIGRPGIVDGVLNSGDIRSDAYWISRGPGAANMTGRGAGRKLPRPRRPLRHLVLLLFGLQLLHAVGAILGQHHVEALLAGAFLARAGTADALE